LLSSSSRSFIVSFIQQERQIQSTALSLDISFPQILHFIGHHLSKHNKKLLTKQFRQQKTKQKD